MDNPKAGGLDPLDERLHTNGPPARPRSMGVLVRSRAALGLQPLTAPALVFVPLGMALGPRGLGWLPEAALASLSPVITLALATLGVFIGLALDVEGRDDRRLMAAAGVEAVVTLALVMAASLALIAQLGLALDVSAVLAAAILGVAASVSSSGAPDIEVGEAHQRCTRIADLDDVLAVVAGAVVVAAVPAGDLRGALVAVTATVLISVLAGLAGWLLLERARNDAERKVLVIGMLALLGGAADYVRCSPLLAGLLAGVMWRVLPGHADQAIRNHVNRFQHPLVLLLLLAAGTALHVNALALWLLVPFVAFRLAGKVIGAWVGTRIVPGLVLEDLVAYLVAPGLIGVAVTLNVLQLAPSPTATAILTAVALGTPASELLALFALPAAPEA